jgi:hypothetical protein
MIPYGKLSKPDVSQKLSMILFLSNALSSLCRVTLSSKVMCSEFLLPLIVLKFDLR